MVFCTKKRMAQQGKVDLQNLNKATLRETHHTPTPFHTVSVTERQSEDYSIDAWNGYHSVPLSAAARDATTLITISIPSGTSRI